MVTRVLIIGGYGNFGSYIARSLAGDANIRLLIGARSGEKAKAFAASLATTHPAEGHGLNIYGDLAEALTCIAPDILIGSSTGTNGSISCRVVMSRLSVRNRWLDRSVPQVQTPTVLIECCPRIASLDVLWRITATRTSTIQVQDG